MTFDKLNESSKEESEQKLSEQERSLYKKVLKIFGSSTLNSENLGKYKNLELSTTEVMKRLQDLELLETVKKFQKKLLRPKTIQEKGEEFERLARVTLMLVENIPK